MFNDQISMFNEKNMHREAVEYSSPMATPWAFMNYNQISP